MLGKSTWAVIAMTCFVEIFTQAHYLHSIRDDGQLSPLFKYVFYYHWVEEVQHATLDELEWQRVHDTMSTEAIDAAVTDLIELVRMIDRILQAQATADGEYFCSCAGVYLDREKSNAVKTCLLKAYRLQYVVPGTRIERFQRALSSKLTSGQMQRIEAALADRICKSAYAAALSFPGFSLPAPRCRCRRSPAAVNVRPIANQRRAARSTPEASATPSQATTAAAT